MIVPIYDLETGLKALEPILTTIDPESRFCLAVAGGSGSGKSKIARIIKDNYAKSVIISIDDYFIKPLKISSDIIDCDHPERYNLERVNLDIRTLKTYGEVVKPTYNKSDNSHGKQKVTLESGGLIILEGLHALNTMVSGEIHYGIFIISDQDLRLQRRLDRDKFNTPQQIQRMWRFAELVYNTEVARTQNHANFIIDNTGLSERLR